MQNSFDYLFESDYCQVLLKKCTIYKNKFA